MGTQGVTVDGYRTLRVSVDRELLRITLDRPQRQNSINDVLLAELHAALDLAERTPQCRAVVLAGGDGVFCTGMDFADATRSDGDAEQLAAHGGAEFLGLLKRLATIGRAVVCVVDGRVAGGGVGIVAASDFVYATGRSTFALPEALWGLLPCCVLPFLIRRVGFQPAHAMTLSTLPVSAERAYGLNLVDEVVEDPEQVLRRLRMRLGKLDPVTIGDAKAYLGRLSALTEDIERTAVAEFTRLMSQPVVRERLHGFATAQALPWERRP